jgi:hypothetical protein
MDLDSPTQIIYKGKYFDVWVKKTILTQYYIFEGFFDV